MVKIIQIVIFCTCLVPSALHGQYSTQWYHLGSDHGLPTDNVYSSIIDRYGYLWMATDQGVVRYNGYHLKVFNTNNGLPSNDVYKLIEDQKGRIWVYSLSYHFGFIENDVFHLLNLPSTNKIIYPSDIYEKEGWIFFSYAANSKADHVFVFFDGTVLKSFKSIGGKPFMSFYVDPKNSEIVTYDMQRSFYTFSLNNVADPLKMLSIKNFKTQANIYHQLIKYTNIWYHKRRLYFTNFKSAVAKQMDISNSVLDSSNRRSINPPDSNIYLFTVIDDKVHLFSNDHIYQLSPKLKIVKSERFPEILAGAQVSYKTTATNNTWYSTPTKGIWNNTHQPSVFAPSSKFSILNSAINVGAMDLQTYWWNKTNNVLHLLSPNNTIASLKLPSIGMIRKVRPYRKGYVHVVSSQGVYVLNLLSGKTYHYADSVHSTTTFNWHFFSNSDFKFEKLPDTLKRMVFVGLYDFHQHSRNNYFAPSFAGFIHYKHDSNDFSKLIVSINNIGRYQNFVFDSFNQLYLLFNEEKIKLFNPVDSTFVEIDKDLQRAFGIKSRNDISVDKSGKIYILENDRLIQIDSRQRTIKCVESNINFINAKILLAKDKIFVAGKFGLSIYVQTNGHVTREALAVNVRSQNYKIVSDIVLHSDSVILLNTDKGIINLNIDQIRKADYKREPAAFQIVINTPVKKRANVSSTIRLPKGTNLITFDVINYLGSGSVVCKYQIEGVHTSWQEPIAGDVSLANLRADKFYRINFYISDDIWVNPSSQFILYIEPYWWQRSEWKITFWILALSGALVLIFITIVLTRKSVAKKNERRRLQTELELRAIHSQINPHFIFNTLSSSLYFITKQNTTAAFDHVSKFSRLLRGYLKSSRERFITLADEIDLLEQYIELQRTRFKTAFRYEINVSENISPSHVKIPSLLLQPLIENAITHGLFNMDGGGFLKIEFYPGASKTELICIIDDNGMGREKAKMLNQTHKSEKNSYGTELTRDLIDIFKRYEQMDIVLEYIDKTEPETGTTVKLTIKNIRMATKY
ncbi:MAG TPA: histidine kinase [Flavipsychrobacter sp.]|nr:histidine kinase [Flavipsychrobacter sp.]